MDVRLGYGTFGKARARLGAFYRVSVRALFDGNGCAAELNGYSGLNAAAKGRQYGAYHIKRLCLILNNLAIAFDDDRYLPHPLLEALVQEGSLGKKTGVGIYDWSSGEKAERKLPGL